MLGKASSPVLRIHDIITLKSKRCTLVALLCLKIPGIYKAVLFLCFILSYIAKKSKMVKVLIWKATFKTENFSTKSFGIYRLFLDVAKST